MDAPAPPSESLAGKSIVFYDGNCGLCHRWVSFVLPRDPEDRFVFTPLGGDTFLDLLSEQQIATLPDSMVLREPDGRLRVKSDAVLAILSGVGGLYGVLATLGRLVPRSIRDFFYDRVAAVRLRFFAAPAETCPVLPPELRHKFVM